MSNLQIGGMIALSMALLTAWYALLLRPRPSWGRGAMAVTLWVGVTGFLGAWGFFRDFASLPPRLPLFVAFVGGVVVSVIFFSRRGRHMLQNPQWMLIGLQLFRVPVELLLASLAADGLAPVEMSYHGRNFDILAGASAPLLAAAVFRFGERPLRALIVLWNLAALALLINVVAHGLLSAPTPFQTLSFAVETRFIGEFPMMWLPLFLVPTAFVLHFLSLRRALRKTV